MWPFGKRNRSKSFEDRIVDAIADNPLFEGQDVKKIAAAVTSVESQGRQWVGLCLDRAYKRFLERTHKERGFVDTLFDIPDAGLETSVINGEQVYELPDIRAYVATSESKVRLAHAGLSLTETLLVVNPTHGRTGVGQSKPRQSDYGPKITWEEQDIMFELHAQATILPFVGADGINVEGTQLTLKVIGQTAASTLQN